MALLPSSGGQVGHQMMMTTILSKHSMKTLFTGYIKYAGGIGGGHG